jgi:hypothetical protein
MRIKASWLLTATFVQGHIVFVIRKTPSVFHLSLPSFHKILFLLAKRLNSYKILQFGINPGKSTQNVN